MIMRYFTKEYKAAIEARLAEKLADPETLKKVSQGNALLSLLQRKTNVVKHP